MTINNKLREKKRDYPHTFYNLNMVVWIDMVIPQPRKQSLPLNNSSFCFRFSSIVPLRKTYGFFRH